MSLKYVQTNTLYQAGSGSIIGATSVVLTTLVDIYGNVLTMTDFGTKGYGTAEPDTNNEESFTFTGIVANANGTYSLTGVSTALAKSPYTETSGLIRQHSGGTKVVITDNVAFWNTFANVNNLNTFIILPQSAATPSANSDLATKVYVDGVAIAGAPNATTGVKGILQLSTQAQVLAKTATGSTGAALAVTPDLLPSTLLSDYKVDTGAANAYVITPAPAITAYVTGQIFSFKAVNANTLASTLNVNGLGTKAIVNSKGGALVANDILAAMIVTVQYDGTSMVMQNPVANAPTTAPTAQQVRSQIFTVSGTWTQPAGVTKVKVTVVGGGGGGGGTDANASQTGGGGGSGSVAIATLTVAGNVTVTVGAAGGGGVGNNNGTTGGSSIFSTVTSIGGSGGSGHGGGSGSGAGGAGGTASGGDINLSGENGFSGSVSYKAGGDTPLGFGVGAFPAAGAGSAGSTGTNYGSGGGGGIANGSSNINGGAGTQGLVIVEWIA